MMMMMMMMMMMIIIIIIILRNQHGVVVPPALTIPSFLPEFTRRDAAVRYKLLDPCDLWTALRAGVLSGLSLVPEHTSTLSVWAMWAGTSAGSLLIWPKME